jgi:phosphatidate cytidylyltransferase
MPIRTLPSIFRFSNLTQRIVTGVVAGALSIFLILVGSEGLLAFVLIAGTLGMLEFYKMIGQDSRRWETMVAFSFWYAACTLTYVKLFRGLESYEPALLGLGLLLLPALSITLLYRRNLKEQFEHLAVLLLGLVYVGLPFLLLLVVGRLGNTAAYDFRIPFGFIILLWSSDTAAYAFGRLMGKHKIFPRHSPKKTWEGFVGAILCTTGLGLYLEAFWSQHTFAWWAIGLMVAIFGLYGDLAESMLKRGVDVKDSGSILPGHGGILDRFDGMLIALPVVTVYLLLSNWLA